MSSKKIVCIEGTKSLKPNFGPCVDDCSYFSSLTFWSFHIHLVQMKYRRIARYVYLLNMMFTF